MATQNLFGDESPLSGGMSDAEKMFRVINGKQGLKGTAELFKMIRDLSVEIKKNMLAAKGETDSKLGMGQMPKFTDGLTGKQKVAGGVMVAGSLGMAMMPNTMSAVTQRIAADSFAGISGLNSRQVILRSNAAVGGGATSAMGPTMAAMSLYAGGGYTATSKTFKNVMPQLGGLSALTGGTNEQMAQGLAGINAMRFLRIGVQARDSSGNLKAPNAIINDTYRFLYGNKKITVEQAAMVLNPGSKGYATISQIAGGDQNLMAIIQQGIIARAKKDKPLTAKDLSGSDKALDILGVGKESPIRTNFRYQTSEARKLQATEKGLVGGFNVAMDATTAVNNGFSRLAEEADGLVNAFAGLRGFLQTLPGAGNTGGMLSGAGSMAMGLGMQALQLRMLSNALGGGAAGAPGGGPGGTPGGFFGGGGKFFAGKAGLMRGGMFAAGALAAGYGANYLNEHVGGSASLHARGMAAAKIGQYALTGAGIGSMIPVIGTGVGAAIGTAYGSLRYGSQLFTGRGGPSECSHGNIGSHACGKGGDSSATMGFSGGNKATDGIVLQMPVPKGTPVTSGYGPRDNSKNPQISKYHSGIDYGVPVGTEITAAANGIVTDVGQHRQYGNYIIIKHGAKSTLYGHLSKQMVRKGDTVGAGQVIALSGGKKGAPGAGTSTGPHLHFEVRDNGGVGAKGRENPKGWFGRMISTIKNVLSAPFRAIKNLFGGKEKPLVSDPKHGLNFSSNATLSSIPLSRTLSSALMIGNSIDFAGFKNEFTPDALGKGIKGNDGQTYINSDKDMVSGDKVGMVGGSRAGLMKFLSNIGFKGKALDTAFAIALAESGGRANALNKTKDYGLFQINMAGGNKKDRLAKTWKTAGGNTFKLKGVNDLFNPRLNAQVAYHMSHGGENWKRWVTFNEGTFAKYLDDAAQTRKEVGMGGGDSSQAGMSLQTETGAALGSTSRSGNLAVSNNHTYNVKVDMKVSIANGSRYEVQKIAQDLKKSIQDEFRINGLVNN